MQDDLGPALVPLVEVLIGLGRLVQRQLVADDERRLGPALGDEVTQLPVVPLDRRLAAADVLALEPERAEVEARKVATAKAAAKKRENDEKRRADAKAKAEAKKAAEGD